VALSHKAQILYLLLVIRTVLFATGPVGYEALVKYGADPYTTIAYILLTGGLVTLALRPLGLHQEPDRSLAHITTGAITLIVAMAVVVASFYVLYAISMQHEAIVETTIMARLSVLLAIPLSILLLGTKIISWRKILIGYICIFSGVAIYKWSDIQQLFGAGGFGIIIGIGIACFGAIFDTAGMYLSKYTRLPVSFTTGLAMSLGGGGLLLLLWLAVPHSDIAPSGLTLVCAIMLGFLTIGVPGLIASTAGRELGQPILVAASTFAGLIATAGLAYVWHGENVHTLSLVIMVSLLALGLAQIQKSEEMAK
jgi:drug/metabolite transporter (DMT)-like permease